MLTGRMRIAWPGKLRAKAQRDSFVWLNANDQNIWLQRRIGIGEQPVRHFLELDRDLGDVFLQALSRTQVKRNAGPAPVVEIKS